MCAGGKEERVGGGRGGRGYMYSVLVRTPFPRLDRTATAGSHSGSTKLSHPAATCTIERGVRCI